MNVAVIFAGGTGQRMNTKVMPKQFLEVHGKPIIIYTLEKFEEHDDIDGIIIVCLVDWIDYLKKLLTKFGITKVKEIVPGGETGQMSIFSGISKAHELFSDEDMVLIHDGVRPVIDKETISQNILCARENGCAVTVSPAIETIALKEGSTIKTIMNRKYCWIAKAPQTFRIGSIYDAHLKAQAEGRYDFVDSASLMLHYGTKIYPVEGQPDNIKITTPSDYYIFRAMLDASENSQIWG